MIFSDVFETESSIFIYSGSYQCKNVLKDSSSKNHLSAQDKPALGKSCTLKLLIQLSKGLLLGLIQMDVWSSAQQRNLTTIAGALFFRVMTRLCMQR